MLLNTGNDFHVFKYANYLIKYAQYKNILRRNEFYEEITIGLTDRSLVVTYYQIVLGFAHVCHVYHEKQLYLEIDFLQNLVTYLNSLHQQR